MSASVQDRPVTGIARRHEIADPVGASWTIGAGVLLAIGLAFLAAPAATRSASGGTPDIAEPPTFVSVGYRMSHNGVYGAEVIGTAGLAIGAPNEWIVKLRDGVREPVLDAALSVDVWMPETELRSPIQARASHQGEGIYRLEEVYFSEAGWWNVALVVNGASGTDSLAFNVVLH